MSSRKRTAYYLISEQNAGISGCFGLFFVAFGSILEQFRLL